MNNINDVFLAKSGYATIRIASEFLNLEIGDRIPTVSQLEDKYGFSRGTIQNALKGLKNLNAIDTKAKGNQGTIIRKKDDAVLLEIMGIKTIIGCMPLPYSKRYEGLATGLISAIEDKSGVSSFMVFSRGASARAEMINNQRCDYIITSKLAGKKIVADNDNLMIIKEFGNGSYLSDHVIIFHDSSVNDIEDDMRIGIDKESFDQSKLVKKVCSGKKVKYVNVSYPNLLKKVISGDIDATVWNKDEIYEKYLDINYLNIEKNGDDTNAVMIVRKDQKELICFLEKYLDVDYVLKKAQLVIEGMETPRY